MEDKRKHTEAHFHPDGIEVKLSTKSINIVAFLFTVFLFLVGTFLFVYIWGDFTAFNVGFETGKAFSRHGLIPFMIPYILIYIILQGTVLYFLCGKRLKSLRWHLDWGGIGLHPAHPLELKYYRVALLLPGILIGLVPAIHGFCTGNTLVFFLGLYGIVCTSTDLAFWYKLRPFDDEDLLFAGKKSYKATVIKRNYSDY